MKKSLTALAIITVITLISACSHTKQGETPYQTSTVEDKKNDDSKNNTVDTITNPSLVTDDKSLEVARETSWIVILQNDVTADHDLVFQGGLKKGDVVTPRLITLYNQDENKVKTASYTLTAPRATFKEDGSAIKGGTFKGDVYVECNNFKLIDATIDGNVYFKDKAAQDSFQLDDSSRVTGKMEIQ